jgi:hypothetical protein
MRPYLIVLLLLACCGLAISDDSTNVRDAIIQKKLTANLNVKFSNLSSQTVKKVSNTTFGNFTSSTRLKLGLTLPSSTFSSYTSIHRVPTSRTINGYPLTSNITIASVGSATTATSLSANGSNCSAGQAPLGVDASGNSEGCFTPTGTYSLPTATSSVLGGVKPDGTSILNTSGVLSATPLSIGALASGGNAVTASNLSGSPNISISSLTFPSETAFSHYKEGTWTPVPSGVTVTSGSPVWSGTYTRIGNQVKVTFAMSGGDITISNAGASTLSGLPFYASLGNEWGSCGNHGYVVGVGGILAAANNIYFGTSASYTGYFSGSITYTI